MDQQDERLATMPRDEELKQRFRNIGKVGTIPSLIVLFLATTAWVSWMYAPLQVWDGQLSYRFPITMKWETMSKEIVETRRLARLPERVHEIGDYPFKAEIIRAVDERSSILAKLFRLSLLSLMFAMAWWYFWVAASWVICGLVGAKRSSESLRN